jgi:hypothetical protein
VKFCTFLVFYKLGFSFIQPKSSVAMARASLQTAVGDIFDGTEPGKPILIG